MPIKFIVLQLNAEGTKCHPIEIDDESKPIHTLTQTIIDKINATSERKLKRVKEINLLHKGKLITLKGNNEPISSALKTNDRVTLLIKVGCYRSISFLFCFSSQLQKTGSGRDLRSFLYLDDVRG